MSKKAALDITLELSAQNRNITLEVSRSVPDIQLQIDKSAMVPPYYEGETDITPILYDETRLETAWKTMKSDVVVQPISIQEISNPKGGRTVIIGAI